MPTCLDDKVQASGTRAYLYIHHRIFEMDDMLTSSKVHTCGFESVKHWVCIYSHPQYSITIETYSYLT